MNAAISRADELFAQRFNDDAEWDEGEQWEMGPNVMAHVVVPLTREGLEDLQASADAAGVSLSSQMRFLAVARARIAPDR